MGCPRAAAVAAYGQGLAEAGWQGPPDDVRLGFVASSTPLSAGHRPAHASGLLDETAQLRTEAVLGLPFEQVVDLWADFGAWQARSRQPKH